MKLLPLSLVGLILIAASWSAVAQDGPKEIVNSLAMKLIRLAPGKFRMGSAEGPPKSKEEWVERDYDESPSHEVTISKPFYLGATEVTNVQFEAFDPEHKKLRGKHGVSSGDDEPVVLVSWQQAVNFCNWLSKKEVKAYRLPTEAEWEYACRAGTTTAYSTGDTLAPEQANFGQGPMSHKPRPVGSYLANPWGLSDMHGNVAEWCLDWFGPYEAGGQTDPVGRASGWGKVVRGWSYAKTAHKHGAGRYCRSANRSSQLPDDADRTTGFRVVQGELPKTEPLAAAELPLHQREVRQGPPPVGPDPAQPYFAKIGEAVVIPKETWGPIYSAWNHFSAITVCPNGDVLAVWYTTVAEEGPECAQAAARLRADTGKWDPPSFFFGSSDRNTHAPVLLNDGRRLYHFCTQSIAGWDDAAECLRTSDDNGATWTRPRIILTREDPRRMSQPCSAILTKSGKLVLAVDGDFGHRDERLMISSDRGDSWQVAGGDLRKAVGKYAIHPAIVERGDGAILAFLRGPDPLPALVSRDLGETWDAVTTPFPGINVGQKAAALRLASGAILLLTNDKTKRLGGSPILALSLDDGQTWPHARKVEAPIGGYMSLTQGDDGVIYLVGSQLKCAACNEAWLREGKAWPGNEPK